MTKSPEVQQKFNEDAKEWEDGRQESRAQEIHAAFANLASETWMQCKEKEGRKKLMQTL